MNNEIMPLAQAKEILTQRLNSELNAHLARENEISASRRLIVALERGAEVEASYATHVEEDRRLVQAIAEHKTKLEQIGNEKQVEQTGIAGLRKTKTNLESDIAALEEKLAGAIALINRAERAQAVLQELQAQ